ncbi:MAG: peptidylprolyl isomerase [Alphaproteobacteria bacterium]|nr:peptidylprolyl isomerase [Alphaproteobacteria bacterium]
MSAEINKQNGSKKTPIALFVAVILVLGAVGAFFVTGGGVGGTKVEALNGITPAAGDKKKAAKEEKAEAKPAEEASAPANIVMEGNPTVAVVDGEEIKRSEVFTMIGSLPPQIQQMPVEQLFPMALDNLVNNKLVIKKSSAAGLDADPEVVKMLEEAKTQVVRNVYVDRQVTEKVNQKAVLKKYEELLERLGEVDEVKARHILLETEEQAKEAIKKLDGGADFATVTKEMWSGAEQQNGGELGYFAKTDMVPEFAEAAFALGVNQYTKDPVKTQFGWHVIKVEEKRKRPQPEFEAVKPQLEQEVRQEVLVNLLKDWQKDAKVKKFDINGNPVKETKSN